MAAKLARGEDFTLEDFLEQMQAVRKMGPMANLLGMMPGHGPDAGAARPASTSARLDRVAAIIQSMTPGGAARPEDHQRLAPGPHRHAAPGVQASSTSTSWSTASSRRRR